MDLERQFLQRCDLVCKSKCDLLDLKVKFFLEFVESFIFENTFPGKVAYNFLMHLDIDVLGYSSDAYNKFYILPSSIFDNSFRYYHQSRYLHSVLREKLLSILENYREKLTLNQYFEITITKRDLIGFLVSLLLLGKKK